MISRRKSTRKTLEVPKGPVRKKSRSQTEPHRSEIKEIKKIVEKITEESMNTVHELKKLEEGIQRNRENIETDHQTEPAHNEIALQLVRELQSQVNEINLAIDKKNQMVICRELENNILRKKIKIIKQDIEADKRKYNCYVI